MMSLYHHPLPLVLGTERGIPVLPENLKKQGDKDNVSVIAQGIKIAVALINQFEKKILKGHFSDPRIKPGYLVHRHDQPTRYAQELGLPILVRVKFQSLYRKAVR